MLLRRRLIAFALAALGLVICAFLIAVLVGQGLGRASTWATFFGFPFAAAAAGAAMWPIAATTKRPPPPDFDVPDWVVHRPDEADAVIDALMRRGTGTVGITTALEGAGGFGKTTLARVVCADDRVQRHFIGGIHLVTVGRDVRQPAALAAKVNDLIKVVAGEEATFTDPELAGERLGLVLQSGPRRLLLLDDVWEASQLAPFILGGRRCSRLVTTRDPNLLAGRGSAVRVDQMSAEQAISLLTRGIPSLHPEIVDGLLGVTGRWPLLLRLANKILSNATRTGADVSSVGHQLLARLRSGGPAAVDDLSGEAGRVLDVGRPEERARAVRATIAASTNLLSQRDAERFSELAVFAEDETMPLQLINRLWHATGQLDELQTSQLCARLSELSLVSARNGGIAMHDVIRDFLRGELGERRVRELHSLLIDAVATQLPLDRLPAGDRQGTATRAWWELPSDQPYMQAHLIEHLLAAGRRDNADVITSDLRWVSAQLAEFGPTAPVADLSMIGTPKAKRLAATITRASHLLGPTDPPAAVVDVLHSRLEADTWWSDQVAALRSSYRRTRIVNAWMVPDLPGPSLRRVLVGHSGAVRAVAVAPDGTWLASGSDDMTVRIWSTNTWQEQHRLAFTCGVSGLAIPQEGDWLAVLGNDGTVRVIGTRKWQTHTNSGRRLGQLHAIAAGPNGKWLAGVMLRANTGLQMWDAEGGRPIKNIPGYTGQITAIAASPDATRPLVALGSATGTVGIWDLDAGRQIAACIGHYQSVDALTYSPDGRWLVTSGSDTTIRIWNRHGAERAKFKGPPEHVRAIAVAEKWFASGGTGKAISTWEFPSGRRRSALTGHRADVVALGIARDRSWLASGSLDSTIRIWDTSEEQVPAILAGRRGRTPEVIVPADGSWFAACNESDEKLRIWDLSSGYERASISARGAFGVSADSNSLFARDAKGEVQVWDTNTWRNPWTLPTDGALRFANSGQSIRWLAIRPRHDNSRSIELWDTSTKQFPGGYHVVSAVIAPDGSWIADARGIGVRIWNPSEGVEQDRLAIRIAPDGLLAVSPDGTYLAVRPRRSTTVQIWNATSWQRPITLRQKGPELRIAAWAADSSWLATIETGDGTVRIWDPSNGVEIATLQAHLQQASTAALAPNGQWLVTGGHDATVRVWSVATWESRAFMRIEDSVLKCSWISNDRIAVGGEAGLYLYGFSA
jgi:WD40 repeat protein